MGANISKLELQANCKLDMLTKQVKNVVKIEPHFFSLWSDCHLLPSDSLALANQSEYSVKWQSDIQLEWSDEGIFNHGILYAVTKVMCLINASSILRRIVNIWRHR